MAPLSKQRMLSGGPGEVWAKFTRQLARESGKKVNKDNVKRCPVPLTRLQNPVEQS